MVFHELLHIALPNKSGNEPQKAQKGNTKAQKKRVTVPFVAPFCAFCVPSPICWAKPRLLESVTNADGDNGIKFEDIPHRIPGRSTVVDLVLLGAHVRLNLRVRSNI